MKKKIFALVAALSLVAAVGAGSTLAYLTSTTDTVTNKFTVGKVDISLSETVDAKATVSDDDTRTYLNVLPNEILEKKPVVTVASDSEACYVFVHVVKEDDRIIYLAGKSMTDCGWTSAGDGVYYQLVTKEVLKDKADKKENLELTVFDGVQIDKNVEETNTSATSGNAAPLKDITVQAYAVQADYLSTSNSDEDNLAEATAMAKDFFKIKVNE